MPRPSATVRLAYQARLLLVSIAGIVGATMACVGIGLRALGDVGGAAVVGAFGVLAFSTWLGWIDYVSATTLALDGAGLTLAGRRIPWAAIRAVGRATGPFRLSVATDAGTVRLQLLVIDRPIPALKLLVAEAARAGAKVEPYLVRLAELAEEEDA